MRSNILNCGCCGSVTGYQVGNHAIHICFECGDKTLTVEEQKLLEPIFNQINNLFNEVNFLK